MEDEEEAGGDLLEDGEDPGLADDDVGPLDLDDGQEVGGLAGLLQLQPLGEGPLLHRDYSEDRSSQLPGPTSPAC